MWINFELEVRKVYEKALISEKRNIFAALYISPNLQIFQKLGVNIVLCEGRGKQGERIWPKLDSVDFFLPVHFFFLLPCLGEAELAKQLGNPNLQFVSRIIQTRLNQMNRN